MKKQRIYELMDGIREDFILEAEPKKLTAVLESAEAKPASQKASAPRESLYVIPGSFAAGKRPDAGKRPTPAKRWVTAACLVLAILLLGGGTAMSTLATLGSLGGMGQAGDGGITSLFGQGFLPSLFPFLSPDETETPHEVTVRDPDEESDETDPPKETEPPETHPCTEGHTFAEKVNRPVTCYAVSRSHKVCEICGYEEDIRGKETLPHTYEGGYCTECGLIEGVVGEYAFERRLWNETETVGNIWNVNRAAVDGTIILPNVCFIEDYGLLPVRMITAGLSHMSPERIIVPEGYYLVSEFARDCRSLTEVSLPSTLKTVGWGAFENCVSLTSLDIPEGVTSIGSFAFRNCTFSSLRIPDGVTDISESTFEGCKELVLTELPPALTTIGKLAFADCAKVNFESIPASVTSIGEGAFKNCASLTQAQIPDGVTVLERDIFLGCSSLVSVRLPDGLKELPNQVFSRCSSLTGIDLPENLTLIGDSAFYGTAISSFRIPQTVKSVGSNAFAANAALIEVVFEGAKTELDHFLFLDCTSLERVVLPDQLRKLPVWLFRNCTSLRDVTLPSALVELDDQIFENCTSLQELVIPDGVKELRFFARDCTSLERIVLPASLNKISEYTFTECPDLRELILSEENTAYKVVDGCLIHVATKTLIAGTCNAVIPTDGSVTVIGINAFSGRNITSVVIPEGVTSIGKNSFLNCKVLEEVRILEGVVGIGENAFYGCEKLERIYLSSTVSSLGEKIFEKCTSLTEIYLEGNVKKWEAMTKNMPQTNVKYTVYCKNGMIEPDGTVTFYDETEK